jgi:metalloprotein, YbeY/UPF0054 family
MNKLKVFIDNRQKNIKIPSGLRLLIRRTCHAVLSLEEFKGSAEISVSLVNNEQIRELNAKYRNKDVSTDVLSFPLGENGHWDIAMDTGAYMLGDIVISLEQALKQSDMYNHALSREVAFLTAHSVLHLLGYDHEKSALERVRMREKEEAALNSLGLNRDTTYLE